MTPLEAHLLLMEIHRLRDSDEEWAIKFDECEKGGYAQAPVAITGVAPGSSVAAYTTITTHVRLISEIAGGEGGTLQNVIGNGPVGEDVIVRVRRHKMKALQSRGNITPRGLIVHVTQVEDPYTQVEDPYYE